MKISKRVREEAAMICAIAASNEGRHLPRLGTAARALADRAFMAVPYWDRDMPTFAIPMIEQWAEAESWLRTGWSPE